MSVFETNSQPANNPPAVGQGQPEGSPDELPLVPLNPTTELATIEETPKTEEKENYQNLKDLLDNTSLRYTSCVVKIKSLQEGLNNHVGNMNLVSSQLPDNIKKNIEQSSILARKLLSTCSMLLSKLEESKHHFEGIRTNITSISNTLDHIISLQGTRNLNLNGEFNAEYSLIETIQRRIQNVVEEFEKEKADIQTQIGAYIISNSVTHQDASSSMINVNSHLNTELKDLLKVLDEKSRLVSEKIAQRNHQAMHGKINSDNKKFLMKEKERLVAEMEHLEDEKREISQKVKEALEKFERKIQTAREEGDNQKVLAQRLYLSKIETLDTQLEKMTLLYAEISVAVTKFHYIFVLDESGSMSGAPWASLESCFNFLVQQNQQYTNDLVSVILFDNKARQHLKKVPFSNNVKLPRPNYGGTSFSPAISLARDSVLVTPKGLTPVVLFFTDGEAYDVPQACTIAADMYRQNNKVLFFAVGVGSGFNRSSLEKLSLSANGDKKFIECGNDRIDFIYTSTDESGLAGCFNSIVQNVREYPDRLLNQIKILEELRENVKKEFAARITQTTSLSQTDISSMETELSELQQARKKWIQNEETEIDERIKKSRERTVEIDQQLTQIVTKMIIDYQPQVEQAQNDLKDIQERVEQKRTQIVQDEQKKDEAVKMIQKRMAEMLNEENDVVAASLLESFRKFNFLQDEIKSLLTSVTSFVTTIVDRLPFIQSYLKKIVQRDPKNMPPLSIEKLLFQNFQNIFDNDDSDIEKWVKIGLKSIERLKDQEEDEKRELLVELFKAYSPVDMLKDFVMSEEERSTLETKLSGGKEFYEQKKRKTRLRLITKELAAKKRDLSTHERSLKKIDDDIEKERAKLDKLEDDNKIKDQEKKIEKMEKNQEAISQLIAKCEKDIGKLEETQEQIQGEVEDFICEFDDKKRPFQQALTMINSQVERVLFKAIHETLEVDVENFKRQIALQLIDPINIFLGISTKLSSAVETMMITWGRNVRSSSTAQITSGPQKNPLLFLPSSGFLQAGLD